MVKKISTKEEVIHAARLVKKDFPHFTTMMAVMIARMAGGCEYIALQIAHAGDRWSRSDHDDNILLHMVHTICSSRSPRPHRSQMLHSWGLVPEGARQYGMDVGTGHGANKKGRIWQYLKIAMELRKERREAWFRELQCQLARRFPKGFQVYCDGSIGVKLPDWNGLHLETIFDAREWHKYTKKYGDSGGSPGRQGSSLRGSGEGPTSGFSTEINPRPQQARTFGRTGRSC